MSDSLWPHGLQHARPPCPSPTPRVYPNSCPLSRWCHLTISSSVVPFSSHLQSFPASGSFQMSQNFTSGGQSIGVSASTSVLPVNTQGWSPLGWTGWISIVYISPNLPIIPPHPSLLPLVSLVCSLQAGFCMIILNFFLFLSACLMIVHIWLLILGVLNLG